MRNVASPYTTGRRVSHWERERNSRLFGAVRVLSVAAVMLLAVAMLVI